MIQFDSQTLTVKVGTGVPIPLRHPPVHDRDDCRKHNDDHVNWREQDVLYSGL